MTEPAPQIKTSTPAPRSAPKKGAAAIRPVNFDRPVARPARMKLRHRGLMLSMLVVIMLPVVMTTLYLLVFAQPQFASQVGFTIRREEGGSASELMGGLSSLMGSPAQSDADLLFEYVQSQEVVERISTHFDLQGHYSHTWPWDPVFSIWPSATIEDLHSFWSRMVRITYNQASGLMLAQVRARDPVIAQQIAGLIVSESELMINRLNEAAQRDATRNAERDLEAALDRLRQARASLASFRVRTQIVDPQADFEVRMGVINTLQQQLAETLVEHDLLVMQASNSSDPRVDQLQRRIEVVRNRINEERSNFARVEVGSDGIDYPTMIAQYEGLVVDKTFAEASYQASMTALDAARSNAARQTLYLENFIQPSLAQRAQYPQTFIIIALTLAFTTLLWAIIALVYYSLRDRG